MANWDVIGGWREVKAASFCGTKAKSYPERFHLLSSRREPVFAPGFCPNDKGAGFVIKQQMERRRKVHHVSWVAEREIW